MQKNFFSFLVFLFLINISSLCFAQNDSVSGKKTIIDSLPVKKVKKWHFDFILDQRTSFLETKHYVDKSTNIIGVSLGWSKKRIRLGFGVYFLNAQSGAYYIKAIPDYITLAPKANIVNVNGTDAFLVKSSIQMYYITPSFEFAFYKSKWIDLSIPLEVGVGYSKLNVNEYFTNVNFPIHNKKGEVISSENVFFPALIGLALMVNLSSDVGLSASAGYRKIIKEIGFSPDYDGFYYQIGLQLFPGNIKRDIKRDFNAWKEKRRLRKQNQIGSKR